MPAICLGLNVLWVKFSDLSARSPIYSHVGATIQGIHTIRASKAEENFLQEFYKHQDLHISAWFLFHSINRWFTVRLDGLVAVFISATAFGCVFLADSMYMYLWDMDNYATKGTNKPGLKHYDLHEWLKCLTV